MSDLFWSEWDGRGLPEAVAWTEGWTEDEDEAIKHVRRLGSIARSIILHQGWVGYIDGDEIPDVCSADGECLETGVYADPESIVRATFALEVVQ